MGWTSVIIAVASAVGTCRDFSWHGQETFSGKELGADEQVVKCGP